MKKAVDGLILRELEIGESDKLLTVLTAEEGRITLLAKGARSRRSSLLAVCHPFQYVNFEYYEKKERRWVSGASVNESFFGVSYELENAALASYLCEIAEEITGEGVAADDVLRMTLNCLYLLREGKKPRDQIKAVYEWFAAAVSGFAPDLSACGSCGKGEGDLWLDVMNGRLLCSSCLGAKGGRTVEEIDEYSARNILLPMDASSLSALRYILSAPPSRIFAFEMRSEESFGRFCRGAETYLLNHLERGFETLTFYKTVK